KEGAKMASFIKAAFKSMWIMSIDSFVHIRRLTARPAESEHLQRKSTTATLNRSNQPPTNVLSKNIYF
ncbi:hypothetical protein ACQKFO_07775, partial [Rossellomorea sp. NPDC071047]|uniref:hypothetical protein n=1 Tax=Rossellomorea sp. NPDC071047 TaxID=3390675 RepID=UPI003D04CF02